MSPNLLLALLCCKAMSVGAFNLEPRIPVIKRGVNGTLFGYSVAEHQILDESGEAVLEHVILVGAPRASTTQPGTYRSGAVYKCRMSTYTEDCRQLNIENSSDPPEEDEIKDDQWLGVTVKSQGPGGYVLACAHRHIRKGPDYQWGLGICYSLTQSLENHREWEPCLNRPVSKAHEQFGYCQAGASGDISKDNNLVIGSPGPYTWRGTVFVNSVTFGIRDDRTWYMGPLLDDNAAVEKYSYLGMAVTSGKFFGDKTSFVGGAPRGNGTGQVVFFEKQKIDSVFLVQLVLNGEQFASSFGYSIVSMDINSDGYLDLVVGSPFYYSKGEGGAIYIYMNSEEGLSQDTEPIKLTGPHESQFGCSLATLGDLNKDGYPDLAVGAPYDGQGAVYIYLGSKDGLIVEPSQVIRVKDLAKEAQKDLYSFGYSLSGGLDLDGNSYPDLLVGAYDSDAVILLRSRPIIDIITTVEGNLTNINPNDKGCPEDRNVSLVCFSFEACFQFNSSVLSHGTYIEMKYRIEAETFTGKKYYRIKFRSSLESESPNIVEKELKIRGVSLFEPHCSRELVYLKEKTDIQTPINFKLTYTLIQRKPRMVPEGDPMPDINGYPILNQQEASKIFEAKFLKNCGVNDICESDLHVVAELNLLKPRTGNPVFYLGEHNQVNLSIIVYNLREPAYDAAVFITHSSTLSYIGRKVVNGDQIECTPFDETVVKCEIGNPMNMGEVEFQIRFSPRAVTDDEKVLRFQLEANTTSIEVTPEDDLVLVADIVRVAELELRGASDPEQVVYRDDLVPEEEMKTGEDVGSLIIHTYEVINHGLWRAKEVQIFISWPNQIENFNDNGKWLLYMMETPQVIGNGFCELQSGIVNPLKLQVKREDEFFFITETETVEDNSRKKRQAPEEIRLENRALNTITMDCESGTARCHHFTCFIRDLKAHQNALVRIRSRLWSKTFVEEFSQVDRVNVISRARIYLDPDLDIQQNTENDYAYVLTRAIPDIPLYQKPEGVPLWIIVLAVCGGLLLLIVLILCLWMLGFFKRKKPGYIPAATSEKEKEFNSI